MKKLLSAVGTATVAWPTASAVIDRRWATAFTGGMLGTYFWYELVHRRLHTHPPTHAYGRWACRNHLQHHFGSPMRNHGVTSPVWDKVFGTYDEPGHLTTRPAAWHPSGSSTKSGEAHPDLADDYLVKGGAARDRDQAHRDRTDASRTSPPPPDV